MRVVPACRFPVDSLIWQPMAGAWMATVVCKITLELRPDRSFPAHEQIEVFRHDRHHGDMAAASLAAASDLVPQKPAADVLLVGSAHAPRNQPKSELLTRLTVARPTADGLERLVDKALRVFSSGVQHDGARRDELPLLQMPLRYERAPYDAHRNPVGMLPLSDELTPLLPTVLGANDDHCPGYGPLALGWPVRGGRLASHPNPPSIDLIMREGDPAAFCAAPPEQRTAALTGDEAVILEHLHPSHALLGTRLSGPKPKMWVERVGHPVTEVPMRCDTLWIDSDRGLCALTWRGVVGLSSGDDECVVTIMMSDASAQGAAPSAPSSAAGLPGGTLVMPDVGAPQPQIGVAIADLHAQVERFQRYSSPWAIRAVLDGRAPPTAAAPSSTSDRKAKTLTPDEARSVRLVGRQSFQLLYHAPAAPRRVRGMAWYPELYDSLEQRPADPELDGLAPSDAQADVDDHREMFQVVTQGPLLPGAELSAALQSAIRDDGKLVSPLVLVEGNLEIQLLAQGRLEAVVDIARARDAPSETLRAACERAEHVAALARPPRNLIELRTDELMRALAKESRTTVTNVGEEVEVHAVRARCFATVPVFGENHVACHFTATGASGSTPAYLPASAIDRLPLTVRVDVRLLAEVHPHQDPTEHDPLCLRILCVARVLQF